MDWLLFALFFLVCCIGVGSYTLGYVNGGRAVWKQAKDILQDSAKIAGEHSGISWP